jgi:hypothetical protein
MKPVLSPRDHAFFLKNGFVIVKKAVPPKTAAAAAAFIDARIKGRAEGDESSVFVEGQEIDACATTRALTAVSELFGEAGLAALDRKKAMTIPRLPRPGAAWTKPIAHTDVDYPSLMPDNWAVTMFVFLTRVKAKGGAFVLFAGSADRNRLLTAATPGLLKLHEGLPRHSGRAKELLAEPGDALLYHHLLGHCGSENVSGAPTRHALKRGFYPASRLAPGGKPFARMSTIEKANSPRFLAKRLKVAFPSPRLEPAVRRCLQGGDPLSGDCAAHDVLRFKGRTWRLFVNKSAPSTILAASTAGWCAFREEGRLDLGGDVVRSLHVFHHGPEVKLFVGTDEGVRLFGSADLKTWREEIVEPGLVVASGHHLGAYGTAGSSFARVSVKTDRPGEIFCGAKTAAELPGRRALDAFIAPVLGEISFALVVETPDLLVSLSRDGDAFREPFVPLAAPSGARQLRLYARSRRYWLMTYLSSRDKKNKMLWGFIDWEKTPARLEPIENEKALIAALEIVGLR